MKSRKILSISSALATLLIAAAPSASYADAAMDACIEAFVAEHVPKDRKVRVRTYRSAGAYPSPSSGRILLNAKGAKSGTQIAAATCIVDGSSISLESASEPTKVASSAR
jgi:hypothetical protein